ncbi:MAG: choice-of-anchor D domain-containing protein [Candidatus Acidiferrales bacterium]
MKKTFPVLVLTLACMAGIAVLIHAPISKNAPVILSALKPIAQKSLSAQSAARAVAKRAPLQPNGALEPKASSREGIAAMLVSAPVVFESAANEAKDNSQFVAQASGMNVSLTNKGIFVRVKRTDNSSNAADTLGIEVRGAGPLQWHGTDEAQGETNYFLGNDPQKWRTHIPRFNRVDTDDAGGLGLAVYGSANTEESGAAQGIEYDVHLDSGFDPAKVRLEVNGPRNLQIDRKGELVMHLAGRELHMKAPAIYEVSTFHTGSQRRRPSSSRRRKPTSRHSAPRGSRGTKPPRVSPHGRANTGPPISPSARGSSNSARKRRSKKTPSLPLGDNSVKNGASKRTPRERHEIGRRIDGGYVLEADGSVGFWVGKHDAGAALLIDPSITLTYASFLGGTGADSINSMAMDASGNVYVAGTTTSAATFPEAANGIAGNIRGTSQLFIAKVAFSNGIGALQYLTFFGGSSAQAGGQVAVDANGNAAVLGTTTSADYPVTDGRAPTQGLTGEEGNDLVVSEVDATGSSLIFSTIFGGNGRESANAAAGTPLTSSLNIPAGQGGIGFDAAGNVYVASDTTSTDLPTPTTGEMYHPGFGGKESDGFIAEFQTQNVPTGANDLLYCSYLGTNSDGPVAIGGLAVDTATSPGVYIAGSTNNSIDGFPATYAFQSQYEGGSSDAFLMKMQLAGTGANDLLYSTLLGGSGMDEAFGVAIDSQGFAYVVGATQSLTFPSIPTPAVAGPRMMLYQPFPPPAPGLPPIQNAFLAVVGWNAGQTLSLRYFTYLGGSGQDAAESVTVPSPGSAYVSGTTTSYDFGWRDNLQPFNGTADTFVAKLNTNQSGAVSLLYATPIGGTFLAPGSQVATFGNAVATDGRGNVYAAGKTTAANFPTAMTSSNAVNGFQQICGSCQQQPAQGDAFIAGIQEGTATWPAVSFGAANVSFGPAGVQIGTEANPSQVSIVANTGEANLNFSATQPLTVIGPNSADFPILSSGCSGSLAPGQRCQVQIGFIPSAAGAEGAFVSIADDAPGSPQMLEVLGNGAAPFTVSPASFDFGTIPINVQTQPIFVTVTPPPNAAIQSIDYPYGGPFLRSKTDGGPLGDCGAALPGAPCDIGITFQSATAGSFADKVTITVQLSGGQLITETVPLTGTAVTAIPIAVVLPSQLIFRNDPVGSSETLSVLISNTGTAPLALARPLTFSGPNASEFSETDDCPDSIPPRGQPTPPNSWCTVNVSLTPQMVGSKTANLVISDNVPGTPQLVGLSGTAVAPPQAQVSPASWDFGAQNVGTQSSAETFTITNSGNASLNFTQAIAITGTNAADFRQTNNCPTSLAPSLSCSISATFSPQSVGTFSAGINFANNAVGSPQSVPLTGSGTLLAQAQITPPSLTFGPQVIGTSSVPQSISIKNAGSAALIFSQIAFTGANAGDFIESDNCLGNEIAPNLSCTAFVRFSPQTDGAKSASLSIADNASNTSQTVTIIGTAAEAPSIQVTPTTINFTPQGVGTTSPPRTVTLINQGTVPITLMAGASSIAIGGADFSDFSETSNCSLQSGLQPGATCTVNVVFSPIVGGTRTAALSIVDSAPGSPQTVALIGSGVQANAQVAPTTVSFGGQAVGTTSAAQTITVTSLGPGQPLNVTSVSLGGTNAADFAESDNCAGPITASCAIDVTFTPVCANASASRGATLTIQDNGSLPSQTVSITGTATGDFCISAPSDSMVETVTAGTTAVFPPTAAPPFSIISVGSFSGSVSLACSSNPMGPACTVAPTTAVTVSPNLPAQIQVQAATSVSSVATFIWPSAGNWGMRLLSLGVGRLGVASLIGLVALIGLLGTLSKQNFRPRGPTFAGIILAMLCVGLAACGGGGGAGPNASGDPPPALAGSYTLTVTANDGGETHTLSLHLNVTP